MKQVSKKQIVSKLRDAFRVEALESRVLLSADPILGQAALLAPDLLAHDADASDRAVHALGAAPAGEPGAALPAVPVAQAPDPHLASLAALATAATAASYTSAADAAVQPDTLYLNQDNLGQYRDGDNRIVLGHAGSNAQIVVGDAANGGNLVLDDTLVLLNPQAGGEIAIAQNLVLAGDAGLSITGSGHTTTISASSINTAFAYINDSVKIDGATATNHTIALTATGGDIQIGGSSAHSLNGDGLDPDDLLQLSATGNILVTGTVGNTDALEGFTITQANNVTFKGEVTVNGNFDIHASGTVTFEQSVHLTSGFFRVTGANLVVFKGGVTVDGGGDIFLEGNEINFQTGESAVIGTGMLSLRPATVGLGIEVGGPPLESSALLNIDNAEIATFASTFSKIVIGRQEGAVNGYLAGAHADDLAGTVRIGAVQTPQQYTFRSALEVYGGSIVVEDFANPAYQFLVNGDIKLDAWNGISIYNQVEAHNSNIALWAQNGAVVQANAASNLDNLSSEPLRALDLQVHAGAGVRLPFAQVNSITVVNTGDGDIVVNNLARDAASGIGGTLRVDGVSQTGLAGDNIVLSTSAGNLGIDGAGSGVSTVGAGGISLSAGGSGSQILVNRAISASGGAIALASDGRIALQAAGITDNGAGGVALTSNSANIALSRDIVSNGGLVSLNAATTIFMDSGTRVASLHPLADSGAVSLVAGGTITLSTLAADGAMTVRSNAGAIVDGLLGDGLNLDGDTAAAALSAATGIGSGNALQTRVAAVTLSNNTAGNVQLREATALRILGASVGGSGSNLVVTTLDGGIAVDGAIDAIGAGGNVLLKTGEAGEGTAADIVIRAGVASTNGNISILSADAIVIDDGAAGSAPRIEARGAGRTLDLQADGAVALEGQARLVTSNGNMRIGALGGDLALGVLDAGTAAVSLRASGAILDAQADDAAPGTNVTAGALRMQAGAGIGSAADALEVQAGALAFAAGGAAQVAAGGNATVGQVAAVRVNRVDANAGLQDAIDSGALAGLSAGGDLLLGGASLVVAGSVNANGGHVRIDASGTLALNAMVAAQGGSITVLAGGDITASSQAQVVSEGGTIELASGAGAVLMNDGARLATDARNIRVAAAAGVTVGLVDARSNADRLGDSLAGQAGWGAVSIVSGAAIADTPEASDAIDVYARALRLEALGAIGAAGNAFDTEAAVLSARGAGMFLREAGVLALDGTGPVAVDRVLARGGLDAEQRVDAAQAGLASSGTLVLQAGGALTGMAGSAVSAGANLVLGAGGDLTLGAAVTTLGATGNISLQSAGAIHQDAAVSATAAGQSVDMIALGLIVMTQDASVATIGGGISLQGGGTVVVGLLDAGSGAVAINAGGYILDADAYGDNHVDIVAGALQMRAGAAIAASANALETRVGTLSAESNLGWIYLQESDAVEIGSVSVQVNRVDAAGAATATTVASQSGMAVTRAGNLVLAAGGAMTVNANVASAGGNVLLKAAGDLAVNGAVTSGGGALSLQAGGAIVQKAGIAGASIDVEASSGIAMDDGVQANASGNVRYATGGTLALGAIGSGAGVSLVAGTIVDSGSTDVDVRAATLRIAATNGAGSGASHLQLAVGRLAASAGGGGLYLDEADALVIDAGAGSVARVGVDGRLSTVNDQALSGLVSGGNLVLATADGGIALGQQVSAAGNLLLAAGGAGADLALDAAVSNSGGNSSLVAGRDLLQNVGINTTAAGKSLELRAGRDILMGQSASSATANGNILLAAGAGVTVSSLNAGTANVGITATGGSIVDGDAAGDSAVDIVAGGLQLRAGNAIGSGTNAIESNVVIATAQAGAGGVYLVETNALTLAGVTVQVNRVGASGAAAATTNAAQNGVAAQGGNVVLVSNGASLVVNDSVNSNGGNLLLQAAGGGMVLNAKVDAGGGALTLTSGGNIAQKADIVTGGAGTVDLQAARAINMDNGTAIRAGANVRVMAGTTMTLGSIVTGGDVSLAATGILDAGGSETDVTAAALRVSVSGANAGFGAPGARIQTAVGSLAANVGGSGGFFAEQAGAITLGALAEIGVRRVGADGGTSAVADAALSGVSSSGALVLTSTGAIAVERVVTAAGNLLLAAGSADLVLDAAVSSVAGSISLGAGNSIVQNADLRALAAGQSIELAAGADIAMQSGSSSASSLRYAAGGDIAVGLLDAGTGGVSLAAGGAIVDAESANTVQTVNVKAGALRMTAGTGIGGGNAIETTVASLAAASSSGAIAIVDSDGLSVPAAGVAVTVGRIGADGTVNALADAALVGVTAAGGSTSLVAATGTVVFGQAQQVGAGQDLELVGDQLQIDQPLAGQGGTLAIRPANPAHDVRLGGSGFGNGGLYLSPALLANLAGGFDRVVVGGGAAAPGQVIHIDGSASAVVFRDSLVLDASGPGSSIFLTGSLAAEGLDVRGPLALADAVTIAGGNGGAPGGDMVFAQGIDAFETSASLVLAAGGDNVLVQGAVGANGALAGLAVRDAHDVRFAQDVSVNGDVIVNATGVVRFDGALHITGGSLVIRGASQVIIGDIVLSGEAGEFVIEADTLVINGDVQGAGIVQLRPGDASRDIVVGGSGTDGAFSITDSMLGHLSGAAGLVIGVQGTDGHAAADAGKVSIVATDFAALSNAPLQVFGSTVVVEASAGSLVAANGLVLDGRDGVVLHDSVSAVRGAVVVYSANGGVQMDAGTVLSGTGAVTAQAAGNLVLAGVEGKHVVVRSGGVILDAAGDNAVNIVADTVALYRMGPQLGMGNAIEVQSPSLFVEAPRGIVVQDTGPDGRTHFYVLDGATMYEAAIAVGETVRHTEDPTLALPLLPASLAPALAATPYFDAALRTAAASGTAQYLATAGQVATAGGGLLVAGAEGLAAGEGAALPLLEFWLEDLVL
ncbi:LEPR-XLL domain-containing protein [Massilia sp. IC2-278]|uniref:LEPR-XLL domain-containing protein n=1 Tax=Massilia sp. IC2-278 TaxID=2887200 RepID=UPI001E613D12|nr:LEPR-XLL domain-containing protein [Massilia sp. IC2-278]MCC2959755.1 LEPR-XLL domain-containing protein [Massilia sp. IC2-278]